MITNEKGEYLTSDTELNFTPIKSEGIKLDYRTALKIKRNNADRKLSMIDIM